MDDMARALIHMKEANAHRPKNEVIKELEEKITITRKFLKEYREQLKTLCVRITNNEEHIELWEKWIQDLKDEE